MKRLFVLLVALASLRLPAHAAEPSELDFVDVAATVPGVRVELPYATDANFLGRKVYPSARCFLRRRTAAKLAEASAPGRRRGGGVLWGEKSVLLGESSTSPSCPSRR